MSASHLRHLLCYAVFVGCDVLTVLGLVSHLSLIIEQSGPGHTCRQKDNTRHHHLN